jgi:hypothetical protein
MRSIEEEEGDDGDDDVRMMRWILTEMARPFVFEYLPANLTVMLYKEHVNEPHIHIITLSTIRHPSYLFPALP